MVYGLNSMKMIRLVNKFPFITFRKKPLTGEDYTTITLHNNPIEEIDATLLKICKNQLLSNGISIHKIRFVNETSFIYDVDNNVINPQYKVMMPNNSKNPIIEIDKPLNTMRVFLGENRTDNNFELLKNITKKSKRGIVLLLSDELEEVMWTASLDDAAAYYGEMLKNLDYES